MNIFCYSNLYFICLCRHTDGLGQYSETLLFAATYHLNLTVVRSCLISQDNDECPPVQRLFVHFQENYKRNLSLWTTCDIFTIWIALLCTATVTQNILFRRIIIIISFYFAKYLDILVNIVIVVYVISKAYIPFTPLQRGQYSKEC